MMIPGKDSFFDPLNRVILPGPGRTHITFALPAVNVLPARFPCFLSLSKYALNAGAFG